MRTAATLATLLVLLMAGCTQPQPTPRASPSRTDDAVSRDPSTVVHRPNAQPATPISLPQLPTFALRYIDQRTALEPMVAVAPSGAAFYNTANPAGPNVLGTLHYYIMRTRDLGQTWEEKTPYIAPDQNRISVVDPYIHYDPAANRLFNIDFVGERFHVDRPNEACHVIDTSDDEGETWETHMVCPAWDHQTLFTGRPINLQPTTDYPSIVYLVDGATGFRYSLDGGQTFSDTTYHFPACGDYIGHGHADPTNGRIYLPRTGCTADNATARPQVAVSGDNGLTWTLIDVNTTLSGPTNAPGNHEARAATDHDGNVYFFWVDAQGQARLTRSTDGGLTWGPAWAVNAPGLTKADPNYIGLVAGSPGRVAFSYVATPGTPAPAGIPWNHYVGIMYGALEDEPTIVTTMTNPPDEPIKRGDCTIMCPGQVPGSGMNDFTNMAADPVRGTLWASLVDECITVCDAGQTPTSAQSGRAAVAVQTGGEGIIDPTAAVTSSQP